MTTETVTPKAIHHVVSYYSTPMRPPYYPSKISTRASYPALALAIQARGLDKHSSRKLGRRLDGHISRYFRPLLPQFLRSSHIFAVPPNRLLIGARPGLPQLDDSCVGREGRGLIKVWQLAQ